MEAAFQAGQRNMLNRLSRIEAWADESSTIDPAKLAGMTRAVFAAERRGWAINPGHYIPKKRALQNRIMAKNDVN